MAAVRGVRGPEGVRSEADWLVTGAPRAAGAPLREWGGPEPRPARHRRVSSE